LLLLSEEQLLRVAFALFKVFALNADALGPFISLRVLRLCGGDSGCGSAYPVLFSAYIPARAAAKRSIVETLRQVD